MQYYRRIMQIKYITEIEHQVLLMVSQGKTHEEISEGLCISPKTVANKKYHGMKKLGIKKIERLIDILFDSEKGPLGLIPLLDSE